MAVEQQTATTLPGEPSGPATAVLAPPKPARTDRKPQLLPPYKVLLHNDDVNTFEHVILSILKLTPLNAEDAIEKTLEADRSGISLLLVTHKERAELYQEQFQSVKLTVTIEPDAA
ncbi:MAG: ATP-dependent Clp protease adapter protein ClpS [Phycisphaerae bacterium]|nr:ATP-dependent Clp protease adapter protein ClpS [Phycisphaerae bacterium]